MYEKLFEIWGKAKVNELLQLSTMNVQLLSIILNMHLYRWITFINNLWGKKTMKQCWDDKFFKWANFIPNQKKIKKIFTNELLGNFYRNFEPSS
jgi:hypothetical protein